VVEVVVVVVETRVAWLAGIEEVGVGVVVVEAWAGGVAWEEGQGVAVAVGDAQPATAGGNSGLVEGGDWRAASRAEDFEARAVEVGVGQEAEKEAVVVVVGLDYWMREVTRAGGERVVVAVAAEIETVKEVASVGLEREQEY